MKKFKNSNLEIFKLNPANPSEIPASKILKSFAPLLNYQRKLFPQRRAEASDRKINKRRE
jgi:hypothetical protein